MSHILTVDGQHPNRVGAVTKSINDLDDISFSNIAANDVLAHNGSAWVSTATAGRASAGMYVNTGGHIAFITAPETSGTSATIEE